MSRNRKSSTSLAVDDEFEFVTFPEDLIPLMRQRKTMIHASNRHNTRSHLMSDNCTSIPSDNPSTSCLRQVTNKRRSRTIIDHCSGATFGCFLGKNVSDEFLVRLTFIQVCFEPFYWCRFAVISLPWQRSREGHCHRAYYSSQHILTRTFSTDFSDSLPVDFGWRFSCHSTTSGCVVFDRDVINRRCHSHKKIATRIRYLFFYYLLFIYFRLQEVYKI